MREYSAGDIVKYKDKYKLHWCDFAEFVGVTEQSLKMWVKGYPKPKEDKMERLFEMYDLLDSSQPKQRWQAFVVLGFGDNYEG